MREPSIELVTRTARSLYDYDRDADNPHRPVMPAWRFADPRRRFVYFIRARAVLRDIGPHIKEKRA